jgi:hypothetical protein
VPKGPKQRPAYQPFAHGTEKGHIADTHDTPEHAEENDDAG